MKPKEIYLLLLFFILNFRNSFFSLYYGYKAHKWSKIQITECLYGHGSFAYLKWKYYESKRIKWDSKLEPKLNKYLKNKKH